MSKKRIIPQQPTWQEHHGNTMQATRVCQVTGHTHVITVSQEAFDAWTKGALAQNVFPELTNGEREILISGFTPAEWEEIFK